MSNASNNEPSATAWPNDMFDAHTASSLRRLVTHQHLLCSTRNETLKAQAAQAAQTNPRVSPRQSVADVVRAACDRGWCRQLAQQSVSLVSSSACHSLDQQALQDAAAGLEAQIQARVAKVTDAFEPQAPAVPAEVAKSSAFEAARASLPQGSHFVTEWHRQVRGPTWKYRATVLRIEPDVDHVRWLVYQYSDAGEQLILTFRVFHANANGTNDANDASDTPLPSLQWCGMRRVVFGGASANHNHNQMRQIRRQTLATRAGGLWWSVQNMRGQCTDHTGAEVPLIQNATMHPGFIIRQIHSLHQSNLQFSDQDMPLEGQGQLGSGLVYSANPMKPSMHFSRRCNAETEAKAQAEGRNLHQPPMYTSCTWYLPVERWEFEMHPLCVMNGVTATPVMDDPDDLDEPDADAKRRWAPRRAPAAVAVAATEAMCSVLIHPTVSSHLLQILHVLAQSQSHDSTISTISTEVSPIPVATAAAPVVVSAPAPALAPPPPSPLAVPAVVAPVDRNVASVVAVAARVLSAQPLAATRVSVPVPVVRPVPVYPPCMPAYVLSAAPMTASCNNSRKRKRATTAHSHSPSSTTSATSSRSSSSTTSIASTSLTSPTLPICHAPDWPPAPSALDVLLAACETATTTSSTTLASFVPRKKQKVTDDSEDSLCANA